jgi:small subunit ribosomal protein S16
MAVKLRLMRMGKKKQPTYRVVAADSRSPRNGRFIEIIGTYEPRQDPSVIKIDNERAVHWLQHGAQPTERVEKLLKISGAWTEATGQTVDAAVPTAAPRRARSSSRRKPRPPRLPRLRPRKLLPRTTRLTRIRRMPAKATRTPDVERSRAGRL